MVRVRGQGGAPRVVLTGPTGERIDTSAIPASGFGGGPLGTFHVVVEQPEAATTLIALDKPRAGRWTVSPLPGSAPITSVAAANGLPAPKVTARVGGRGHTRTLSYAITNLSRQRITFAERGARTYQLLGQARGRRGKLSFTPGPGRAGTRQIVAMIESGGAPVSSAVVATYSAPGAAAVGRPRGLRARRRGGALAVRWRPAPGAVQYSVQVAVRSVRTLRLVRGRSVRLTGLPARGRGSVTVAGVGHDGRSGPAVRVRLR